MPTDKTGEWWKKIKNKMLPWNGSGIRSRGFKDTLISFMFACLFVFKKMLIPWKKIFLQKLKSNRSVSVKISLGCFLGGVGRERANNLGERPCR